MLPLGFVIKPVIKKKKEPIKKRLSKKIEALCVIEDNNYYAVIKVKEEKFKLEFTSKSYNLTGREIVFSRNKDEHGKYIRFIRKQEDATFFPGSSDLFVPFSNNWYITGYIVKISGKQYFDFIDLVCPKSQYYIKKEKM